MIISSDVSQKDDVRIANYSFKFAYAWTEL